MTTVFYDWTYGGFAQVERASGGKYRQARYKQPSLWEAFGNARHVLTPKKVKSDVQTKKTDAIKFW